MAACPVDCISHAPARAGSVAAVGAETVARYAVASIAIAGGARERTPSCSPSASARTPPCHDAAAAGRSSAAAASQSAPPQRAVVRLAFQLLIAVILSAQATDKGVNLATRELFRQAPTPAAMLELGLAGLKRHIRTIGLYNAKARNIIATCRQLIQHHGGEVPARSRVARAIAWGRPQDSQCGAQHRFR